MLLKDADEERRQALYAMIMTPSEDRLTGDEELDEMPMPSWWQGEAAAAAEAQSASAWYSRLQPTSDAD